MRKTLTQALLMLTSTMAFAEKDTVVVEKINITGPYVQETVLTTTDKDANNNAYDQSNLQWDMPMYMNQPCSDAASQLTAIKDTGFVVDKKGIYQLAFCIDNNKYQKVAIQVKAKSRNTLYFFTLFKFFLNSIRCTYYSF